MGLRQGAEQPETQKNEPRKIQGPVDNEIRGKVRMNAIISGYEVASHLAATLADSPAKVKETLHSIAVEVAAKIEEYTFRG